jgi:ribosomal protein L14
MKIFIILLLLLNNAFSQEKDPEVIVINMRSQISGIGESILVSLKGSNKTPKKGANGCVYLSNIKDDIALATIVSMQCSDTKLKDGTILKFENTNLKSMDKKTELNGELAFLQENYSDGTMPWHFWILISLALCGIVYWIWKITRTNAGLIKENKFNLKQIKKNRNNIELAYKFRDSILDESENKLKAQRAFNYINKIQFKKNWDDAELDEAYKGLKEIRLRERI